MTDRYFKKSFIVKTKSRDYMVIYTYNLSLWEAEQGDWKLEVDLNLNYTARACLKENQGTFIHVSLSSETSAT